MYELNKEWIRIGGGHAGVVSSPNNPPPAPITQYPILDDVGGDTDGGRDDFLVY